VAVVFFIFGYSILSLKWDDKKIT